MNKDAENVYDISNYSEEELYNILDLTSPTDRELEAKIISMIDKYKINASPNAEKLVAFFEDIYSHFFMSEEEVVDNPDNFDENGVNTIMENAGDMIDEPIIRKADEEQGVVTVKQVEKVNDSYNPNSKISLTKPLSYSKGRLNPLLNQTIKRVISIDSQYRENKEDLSTEFTFNLSDPLKDVVSLKLYSVQIPYTWYTINNNFGSNFFTFTANSPGIKNTNGSNDFTISVNAGNYTAQELVNTLNSSIGDLKNIVTDISFGTTGLSLNPNTSLVTMDIDINKRYNETSYYLNFVGYRGYPSITDDDFLEKQKESIPSILGFRDISYNLFHIKSQYNSPSIATDTTRFQLTENNNFFTVYRYTGEEVSGIPTNIDMSFNVTLSQNSGSYTRSQLRLDLDNQIKNNTLLSSESYIKRYSLSSAVNSQTSFELRLKTDRFTTNNIASPKIKIIFPTGLLGFSDGEPDIFVGSGSVFGFESSDMELNNLISEETPLNDSTLTFIPTDTPRIHLYCNKTNYLTQGNDIIINIDDSIDGYTLSQFINVINYKMYTVPEITNANSIASINNNSRFELALDITKNINQDSFHIDITGGILDTLIDISYNSDTSFNLSDNNNLTFNIPDQAVYTTNVFFLARLTGKTNSSVETSYTIDISMNPSYFTGITEGDGTSWDNTLQTTYSIERNNLIEGIRDAFQSYSDVDSDLILIGSDINTTRANNLLSGTLDINILKQLTENDYSIQFIDPSGNNEIEDLDNNIWRDLNVDQIMIDSSFALANSILSSRDISNIDLSGTIFDNEGNQLSRIVKGYESIIQNQIRLSETTNKIQLIPYEEGVIADENIITITVPLKDSNNEDIVYTRTTLIDQINVLFEENPLTNGSQISIIDNVNGTQNAKINITINKAYTASDYNITFFDNSTFARCFAGVSSVRNATWDTTLGWILGFRENTVYSLSTIDYDNDPLKTKTNDVITITGDTTISTNLFNYLLLCLDDYNQNHLNDGLVTITTGDTFIQPSSYTNKSNFVCDPATGQVSYNTANDSQSKRLTQKQLYSVVEIANSANNSNIISNTGVTGNNFGTGPFEKDVFGLIPLKLAGLQNGQSFVEFGGTLQNQERTYFGPVNLKRMTVRLKTDRGNVLDLNGSNWSFSLVCEQLYKQTPDSEGD